MKNILLSLAIVITLNSCSKDAARPAPVALITPPAETFTEYNIAAGGHYCNLSAITPVNTTQMRFKVKFDSTAIYTTLDPLNQYDINKLYGFSEGYDPHLNSARIGWSYNAGKLRLYAYAYNNGQRISQEICPVNVFETITCAIAVQTNKYIFSVNEIQVQLTRALTEPIASGYQLFPYFGGDETAPHDIRIWIQQL